MLHLALFNENLKLTLSHLTIDQWPYSDGYKTSEPASTAEHPQGLMQLLALFVSYLNKEL
jgi:hypothetical protein